MPGTVDLNQADPAAEAITDTGFCVRASELELGASDEIVEAIRLACTHTGYFYVEPAARLRNTMAATLLQMKRFFSLEDDDPQKLRARQDERGFGWVPRYAEPAYQPGTVSGLEAFDVGLEALEKEDSGWPSLPRFRTDIGACWNELHVLGDAILRVLGRALKVPPDFLVRSCNSGTLDSLRLLHYAGGEITRVQGEVGIAAHTDFEVMTLLYQTSPGLELFDANGRWVDAPVCDGRIVVLLDDMIERWTNGTFQATGHRVRTTESDRDSIVMFIAANDDIQITALPQFVSAEMPVQFPPVTQAGHIDNELRRAAKNRTPGQA